MTYLRFQELGKRPKFSLFPRRKRPPRLHIISDSGGRTVSIHGELDPGNLCITINCEGNAFHYIGLNREATRLLAEFLTNWLEDQR